MKNILNYLSEPNTLKKLKVNKSYLASNEPMVLKYNNWVRINFSSK